MQSGGLSKCVCVFGLLANNDLTTFVVWKQTLNFCAILIKQDSFELKVVTTVRQFDNGDITLISFWI